MPLEINRINSLYSKIYYDKRKLDNDEENGIAYELTGFERASSKSNRIKKIWNKNIIGYLVSNGAGFDNPDLNSAITISGRYDANGFYLRSDNYLEKLPMFCAGRYITYNRQWTERGRIMKSGDGVNEFKRDVQNGKLAQWLLKCLLFTCLEMQNHMRSLNGSDGRYYRNELCLDTTHGSTLASNDLKKLNMNDTEKELFGLWQQLLKYAKQTKEYKPELTYGLYQICDELDTFIKNEKGKTIYNYVELHSIRLTIKDKIKDYYNTEIVPTLFKYQFLK